VLHLEFIHNNAIIPSSMKLVNILGTKLADISQPEALSWVKNFLEDNFQHYITTPNPEIVLLASYDKNLNLVINNSDLAIADGFGLKIAGYILGEKLDHRITGADFAEAIVALAESEGWPIFLLGSENDEIAQMAESRLKSIYNELKIVGAQSGGMLELKNKRWESNDQRLIEKINNSGAKILFVGFGCPKQEKWIFQNLDKLPKVKLAMTVGGTIDFWSGKRKRAFSFVRKAGLEWLWRLIIEPSRIKRIWQATAVFLFEVIKWRYRMFFKYRENAAAFIVNNNEEVLLIKRAGPEENHWQMPQGGIENFEDAPSAAVREAKEETGITKVEFIGECSNIYVYEYPSKWHKIKNGFKGQEQKIVYLRYLGNGSDIKLDNKEASDYEWVYIDNVVNRVFERRRIMAQMSVEGYKQIK
jgi:N-acetylglucosaminyldiphosphoundecaprenol N-acetyl-beta-D-mannosaminyltransferase